MKYNIKSRAVHKDMFAMKSVRPCIQVLIIVLDEAPFLFSWNVSKTCVCVC